MTTRHSAAADVSNW